MRVKRIVFLPGQAERIHGIGRNNELYIGKKTSPDANNPPCEISHLDFDPRCGLITIRKKPLYPEAPNATIPAAKAWSSGNGAEQQCEADCCGIIAKEGWMFYWDDEQQQKQQPQPNKENEHGMRK